MDTAALKKMAQKLRRDSLVSTSEAGSGHPTTCMSCAEIMAVLYFHELRFDPQAPGARDVDEFVLSKGHAAPILWAALKEASGIQEDLGELRRFGSPLEGHPTPNNPWVRVATGSLGQGLSAGLGMALAKRSEGLDARVYCLLGDGECAEGSVWEALMLASRLELDNLVAIVDVNGLGQSDPTSLGHDLETYRARFSAFGWNAVVIDGHDVDAILAGFENARSTRKRPTVLLAKTQKGKGVSFLEAKPNWHGKPLKKGAELDAALAEIGDADVTIPVAARRAKRSGGPIDSAFRLDDPALTPEYPRGSEVATREAFGTALAKLGAICPAVVALDADVKNSTYSEKFGKANPGRFVECFIAEQNMASVALGLATAGRIPFVSTFACFMSRAFDQIRMAGISRPPHLVFVGTHSGVSIGEDGASQMGLEDLALFRATADTTVLYPSDAVSAERLVYLAASTRGIVYVRMSRPKTPTLYEVSDSFEVGGSKVLRHSENDRATVVAAGVTVAEALAAADELQKEGIAIRVIDAYSVKPLDEATLRRASAETGRLLTVEDHYQAGGLGEAVAALGLAPEILCVRGIPRSGQPRELLDWAGISASAIARAVRARQ